MNAPRILLRGVVEDGQPLGAEHMTRLLAIALLSGVWDQMSPLDREQWVEHAILLDTPGGRALYAYYRKEFDAATIQTDQDHFPA